MTIQQVLLCVYTLIDVLLVGYIYQKYSFYIFCISTVIEVLIIWSIGLSYNAWIAYWIINVLGVFTMLRLDETERPFKLSERTFSLVITFLFYKLIGAL